MKRISPLLSLIFLLTLIFSILNVTPTYATPANAPARTLSITNGMAASLVLGAPDFTTVGSFANVRSVTVDPVTGKVFVADMPNSRVLRYASTPTLTNGAASEAEFGVGTGGTLALSVSMDATGHLWIASQNRVVRYDNAATRATSSTPDMILGQDTFGGTASGTAANRMNNPHSVYADTSGRLWVADLGNHRILRFDNVLSKPTTGASADGVLGQSDFVSGSTGGGPNRLNYPNTAYVDPNGTLWVADRSNNRVLRFDNAAAKANGANADGVLGQPNFTSYGVALTQSGMNGPYGMSGDPATGRLFVSDTNARLLIFNNAAAKPNGANADNVIGQTDFTSNSNGLSATKFNNLPTQSHFDPTYGVLWVPDFGNQRVLMFGLSPKIYAMNYSGSTVSQANLDGTGGVSLGNLGGTLNGPHCIALDVANNRIFVTNNTGNTVVRANLDGTGGTTILGGFNHPWGIALDVANNRMYVANGSGNNIIRANLDGSNVVDLGNLNGTLNYPSGIALDLVNSRMYVVNGTGSTISMGNLDGTGGVSLGTLGGLLTQSYTIALDVANNKMYVTNGSNATNKIVRANLDGSSPTGLGNPTSLTFALGIALDLPNGKMYVTNYSANRITRANLDGTGGEDLGTLNGTLNQPYCLALSGGTDPAPVVNSFTATSPSSSLNIPITAFTASDNVAVTGYLITESATPPAAGAAGWTSTAPGTYTVASYGNYTLYPWARDTAGNVSAVFATPRTVVVAQVIAPGAAGGNGPGGVGYVGTTGNLQAWYRADRGVYTDGCSTALAADGATNVACWKDQSGKSGNNATLGTGAPTYNTNVINGQPVLTFNGSNSQLVLPRVVQNDFTIISLFRTSQAANVCGTVQWYCGRGLVDAEVGGVTNDFGTSLFNGRAMTGTGAPDATIANALTWNNNAGHMFFSHRTGSQLDQFVDGANTGTTNGSAAALTASSRITIGSLQYNLGYFQGNIPEVILFSANLPDVDRILVENYLSAKYAVPLTANDVYDGDGNTSGNGDFDQDMAGIGQSATGNRHTQAFSAGIIVVDRSFLKENGDWLTFGHRTVSNNKVATELPTGGAWDGVGDRRWERHWYFDRSETTINGGLVDIIFDFSEGNMNGGQPPAGPASNYRLLKRDNPTGPFTDIATASAIVGDQVQFLGVDVTLLGSNFTLGTLNDNTSPTAVKVSNLSARGMVVSPWLLLGAAALLLGLAGVFVLRRR
jgi:DNA-binding beta-propeller fold protein YncE